MQLGLLAFLGAFAGFYLGLAAYLFLRTILGLRGEHRARRIESPELFGASAAGTDERDTDL